MNNEQTIKTKRKCWYCDNDAAFKITPNTTTAIHLGVCEEHIITALQWFFKKNRTTGPDTKTCEVREIE